MEGDLGTFWKTDDNNADDEEGEGEEQLELLSQSP
jgi:hypothetical protein